MTDDTDTRRSHHQPTTHSAPDMTIDDDPHTCPICNTEIETTRKVGEVTYELDPCGHQVDDETHADLFNE